MHRKFEAILGYMRTWVTDEEGKEREPNTPEAAAWALADLPQPCSTQIWHRTLPVTQSLVQVDRARSLSKGPRWKNSSAAHRQAPGTEGQGRAQVSTGTRPWGLDSWMSPRILPRVSGLDTKAASSHPLYKISVLKTTAKSCFENVSPYGL